RLGGEIIMSTSVTDQRMHPRWTLKSSVSVFEQQNKEYLGLLVDCSEQGLMISSYDYLAQVPGCSWIWWIFRPISTTAAPARAWLKWCGATKSPPACMATAAGWSKARRCCKA